MILNLCLGQVKRLCLTLWISEKNRRIVVNYLTFVFILFCKLKSNNKIMLYYQKIAYKINLKINSFMFKIYKFRHKSLLISKFYDLLCISYIYIVL